MRSTRRRKLWMLAMATPGTLLQIASVAWLFGRHAAEVELLAGILLFALGSILSTFAIERFSLALGRRASWGLAALLGPVGPVIALSLSPSTGGVRAEKEPGVQGRSAVDRVAGILLTLLVSIALVWLGTEWLDRSKGPRGSGLADMARSEKLAYRRLTTIIQAQERYREHDRDGDGRRSYASFHVHLYRSVRADGTVVPVDLIPRRLGFAMSYRFALDGYFYRSLHHREPAPGAEPGHDLEELDPEEEWAVAALPSIFGQGYYGQTDSIPLIFIADHTGRVWAHRSPRAWRGHLVRDPAASGWTEIRSVDQLEELRGSMQVGGAKP